MAIKHLTYLDIDEALRKQAVAFAKKPLREMLASPVLTSDQRKAVRERIAHLDCWEKGQLGQKE